MKHRVNLILSCVRVEYAVISFRLLLSMFILYEKETLLWGSLNSIRISRKYFLVNVLLLPFVVSFFIGVGMVKTI